MSHKNIQPNPSHRNSMSGRHSSMSSSAPSSAQRSQMVNDAVSDMVSQSSSVAENAESLAKELTHSEHSIVDINKLIEENTQKITDVQKQIHNLRNIINSFTNAAMSQGESSSAMDPTDEITSYNRALNEAENKLYKLHEERKELLDKFRKLQKNIQKIKEKLEQIRSNGDEKGNNKTTSQQKTIDNKSLKDKQKKELSEKQAENKSQSEDKRALQQEQRSRDAQKAESQKIQEEVTASRNSHDNPSRRRAAENRAQSKARYNNKAANRASKESANVGKSAGNASGKALATSSAKTAQESAKAYAQSAQKAELVSQKTTQAASKGLEKVGEAAGKAIQSIGKAVGEAISPIMPYILVALLVIALFVALIVIVVCLLVHVEPLSAEYNLKEAVYLTEQDYHTQILGHLNEFFYNDENIDDSSITYFNNSLNWKEIICYFYVIGCSRDGTVGLDGEEFTFTFNVNADEVDVRNMVRGGEDGRSFVLSRSEMDLLTEGYNALNTIICYPDDRQELVESYYFENVDDFNAKKAELDEAGITYTSVEEVAEDGGAIYLIQQYEQHRGAIVNVEHTDLLEYAENSMTPEEYELVQNCLASIENDDRSLAPTFYDMWQAIRELTAVDENARDMIVEEAYAMWIMSGGYSTGGNSNVRNAFGVEEPIDITIYRECGNGAMPFRFVYLNTEGNTVSSICNALPWLNGSLQMEEDVPVFLDPDYTYAGNQTIAYSDQGINVLSVGSHTLGDDVTYYNSMDELDSYQRDNMPLPNCANMDWNTYSYHCINPSQFGVGHGNIDNPWCAAFVSSLAMNYYPGGCFFTERDFFIDAEHPSWTLYYPNENATPWAEANAELVASLAGFADVDNFGDWCVQVYLTFNAARDTWTAYGMANYINALHLSGHTDYYRLNLTNQYSSIPVGLYSGDTEDDINFPPSAATNTDYRPDADEFSDWMGVDLGDVVRFETRELNVENGTYSVTAREGHAYGWYAPRMTFTSSMGEYRDRGDLFCDIAGTGGILQQILESAGLDIAINYIGDNIVDLLQEIGILDDSELGPVLPTYIDSFQSNYCSIFGEVREETQGLFMEDGSGWGSATCTSMVAYYRSFGNNGIVVYGNNDIPMDMYEPSAGDVLFYDSDGDGVTNHVGIIVYTSENSRYVGVMEGNTGPGTSENSGQIGLHYVNVDGSNIYAIAHLPYGGE